jgi:predicted CoA-binding protein
MKNNIDDALKQKNWAVLGATYDRHKFGYKVFNKLKKFGYNVFPVNPGLDEIEGIKCYKSINEIPEEIDVVSLIINPKIGVTILEDAKSKGVKTIWCQPGANSEEIVNKAAELGLEIIHDQCVLVELGYQ